MPTGRNPDHMTTDERRREIAGILAAGVLRAVSRSRRRGGVDSGRLGESCLDEVTDTHRAIAAGTDVDGAAGHEA